MQLQPKMPKSPSKRQSQLPKTEPKKMPKSKSKNPQPLKPKVRLKQRMLI